MGRLGTWHASHSVPLALLHLDRMRRVSTMNDLSRRLPYPFPLAVTVRLEVLCAHLLVKVMLVHTSERRLGRFRAWTECTCQNIAARG